jgi:hypothetical protein
MRPVHKSVKLVFGQTARPVSETDRFRTSPLLRPLRIRASKSASAVANAWSGVRVGPRGGRQESASDDVGWRKCAKKIPPASVYRRQH